MKRAITPSMAGIVSSVISASRQFVLNSAYRLPTSSASALTICSRPLPTNVRTCSTSLVMRVMSWPVWAWSWYEKLRFSILWNSALRIS